MKFRAKAHMNEHNEICLRSKQVLDAVEIPFDRSCPRCGKPKVWIPMPTAAELTLPVNPSWDEELDEAERLALREALRAEQG